MILREIKNMYIKNRLTEGVDFKRYNWLKGDGIINYDKPINYLSDNLRIKIRNLDSNSGYNTIWVGGDTNPGKNDWSRCIIDFDVVNGVSARQVQWCEYVYRNGYYLHFPLSSDNIYTFDININRAIINGVTYSMTSSRCNVTTPFVITLRKADSIAYCKLNNVDMYPCQLLKSIPATLDANNIARSAGECGMYDSISGKFYGNVASTGTFTVEGDVEPETHTGLQQIYQNRLIEGVDYETYEWLKADIPIGKIMMSLPINSKNFEFKRNFIKLMNSAYFATSDSNNVYAYFITDWSDIPNNYKPQIWNINTSQAIYVSPRKIGLGIHTIIANDNGVTISSVTDTVTLPWYGEPNVIRFNNATNINKNTIHLTSTIKVDGVTRYVPCQLLRSIPRNLDAQCKERVAGECGMIDLISGKFYGNIASSGTFTVENDYDGWLKNCSILFDPATAAVYTNYYPPHYEFYGRVEVAKLTSEFVNFGFIQMSNTQVKAGDNVFNADFGANKWATFMVKCMENNYVRVEVNGVDLGSTSYPTIYSWAPHIYLYDIMQINKIEMWVYPRQEEPTYSYHDSFIPRQDIDRDDNKQYLTNDSDRTFRIYAD